LEVKLKNSLSCLKAGHCAKKHLNLNYSENITSLNEASKNVKKMHLSTLYSKESFFKNEVPKDEKRLLVR
jgi:hypothetical protein